MELPVSMFQLIAYIHRLLMYINKLMTNCILLTTEHFRSLFGYFHEVSYVMSTNTLLTVNIGDGDPQNVEFGVVDCGFSTRGDTGVVGG